MKSLLYYAFPSLHSPKLHTEWRPCRRLCIGLQVSKANSLSLLAPITCLCYNDLQGPSDPCWPSSAEWASLNDTLSGRLLKAVPPASACYKTEDNYNAAECKRIVEEWNTSIFHSSDPFSVLSPSWSGNACPPLYPNGTGITGDPHAAAKGCSLGNSSPYVANATSATHVQTNT